MSRNGHLSPSLVCLAGLLILQAAWLSPARAGDATSGFQSFRDANLHLSEQDPRQLPMKLRALMSDEYSFFRGTADLYFAWCKSNVAGWLDQRETFVMLHGDVHLGNMGTHRVLIDGKPQLAFGLVDLDEAVVGPFQLDLLRGAVSLRYSARQNGRPLDDTAWRHVVSKLHDGYRETLEGRMAAEALPDRHPMIRSLYLKAGKDSIPKHAGKYADLKSLRFLAVRNKKKKPSDLMEPVPSEIRSAVVKALQDARSIEGESFAQALGLASREALGSAVSDVALWTRLGSAGSQGLDKYLILLNPEIVGKKVPLMIEMKEEPSPAAARAGLLAAAEGGFDRARQVAEAHAAFWSGMPMYIGFTSMGSKGFLVRAKGPWGEELSSEQFQGTSALDDAALLMGRAIGLAHRKSLHYVDSASRKSGPIEPDSQTSIESRLRAISALLATSKQEIEGLGPRLDAHLMEQFEELRRDDAVRKLVAIAEDHIRTTSRDR